MVKGMKPIIIKELGPSLRGKPQPEARKMVDDYFARIVWSLEKDEWDRMSEAEKSAFLDIARKKKSPPRRYGFFKQR